MDEVTGAKTYTSEGGPVVDRRKQLTDEVVSGYKGLPQKQTQLGEQLLSQDVITGPLAKDRGNIIQQLFDYDKSLNQKYSQPGGDMYIKNPLERAKTLGTHESDLWKALAVVNDNIQTRRKVLGTQAEQGLEAYKAELTAKEKELQYMDQPGEMNEWERNLKIKDSIRDDILSAKDNPDLLGSMMRKYGNMVSPDEILQAYNLYSPTGPVTEAPSVLASKYGTKYTEDMNKLEQQQLKLANAQRALKELVKSSGYDPETKQFGMAHGKVGGRITALLRQTDWADPSIQAFFAQRELTKGEVLKALRDQGYPAQTPQQLEKASEEFLPDITDNSAEMEQKFKKLANLLNIRQEAYESYAKQPITPTIAKAGVQGTTTSVVEPPVRGMAPMETGRVFVVGE